SCYSFVILPEIPITRLAITHKNKDPNNPWI
ncbi:MAG: hypothetical protein ACI8YO_002848, partial [Gammaproteobacteria bacterium]